ncbi:MAG: hypothetical protein IJ391_00245 [Clostridia bacterium]|nr:hypothetical protein [Clostridia bacterium]
MTSNTYNKIKDNDNTLAQPAQGRSRSEAVKSESAVIGNTAHVNTGVSGNTRSGQSVARKGNTRTGAVVTKKRDKYTKPEEIKNPIPRKLLGVLGFDAKEKFETIAVSTANRHPVLLNIVLTIIITAMFMTVVINAVSVNKLKTETTQMNSYLAELIEKESELSLELEKRDDLRYIREVALNQYGMIDKKHVTKYYISLEKDPKVEITDKSGSEPIVDGTDD